MRDYGSKHVFAGMSILICTERLVNPLKTQPAVNFENQWKIKVGHRQTTFPDFRLIFLRLFNSLEMISVVSDEFTGDARRGRFF